MIFQITEAVQLIAAGLGHSRDSTAHSVIKTSMFASLTFVFDEYTVMYSMTVPETSKINSRQIKKKT